MTASNMRGFKLSKADKPLKQDKFNVLLMLTDSQPLLTYVELSTELGIPVGTVKSRLSRARTLVLKNRAKEATHEQAHRSTETV